MEHNFTTGLVRILFENVTKICSLLEQVEWWK